MKKQQTGGLLTMDYLRATRPDQKKEREDQILAAARKLFLQGDYGSAGLNAIAREAGFTKSNLYRYFSSREEIFLRIFGDTSQAWAAGLETALKTLRRGAAPERFAEVWTRETARHTVFLDLAPLAKLSLERNSSEQHLREFFQSSLDAFEGVFAELARIYPELSMQELGDLSMHFYYLATGLWAGSQPGETEKKVLKDPAFAATMSIDFEASLKTGIANLLKGARKK
ncbi:MAG: TetR family transcriptional regulator [bacterium]|nr:TetR family transcriptional regulator [bacterium]